MPATLTYPGVYVEELPSGVHTIIGVSTSETAFVDYFSRGPVGEAVRITDFNEFERRFGGLNACSEASYAIMQYFLNGGTVAWVVRVVSGGAKATRTLEDEVQASLRVKAQAKGTDGRKIKIKIDYDDCDDGKFNLTIQNTPGGQPDPHLNIPFTDNGVKGVQSQLVKVTKIGDTIPATTEVFLKGGTDPSKAEFEIGESLKITALAEGKKGDNIQIKIDYDDCDSGEFNLTIQDTDGVGDAESHKKLSSTGEAVEEVEKASQLVTAEKLGDTIPALTEDTLKGGIDGSKAKIDIKAAALRVDADSAGTWGNNLQVGVDYQGIDKDDKEHFNLVIREKATVSGQEQVISSEVYRNLSMTKTDPHYAINEVNHASELVQLTAIGTERPNETCCGGTPPCDVTNPTEISNADSKHYKSLGGGSDGDVPPNGRGELKEGSQWMTEGPKVLTKGLDALDKTSFNILCLPAASAFLDSDGITFMKSVIPTAVQKCQGNRAFLIIDVKKDTKTKEDVITLVNDPTNKAFDRSDHAAVYYPRITIPDPLNGNKPRNVGPSGTIAGLYARIDTNRGVWKAPAGTEATLSGVTLVEQLTDMDNGELNPLGINALRALPVFGNVCWGARTLDGADVMTSDFKYIPVRRLTSYIESSLYESTKWAVFEPNDETLWSQLRMSIGTFMADLAKQGAFYRYVVTCDDTTTTPSDIEKGVVNIVVAFAPVKPAEFVVLKIQQLAGQTAT